MAVATNRPSIRPARMVDAGAVMASRASVSGSFQGRVRPQARQSATAASTSSGFSAPDLEIAHPKAPGAAPQLSQTKRPPIWLREKSPQ